MRDTDAEKWGFLFALPILIPNQYFLKKNVISLECSEITFASLSMEDRTILKKKKKSYTDGQRLAKQSQDTGEKVHSPFVQSNVKSKDPKTLKNYKTSKETELGRLVSRF